jgi:hypothetical protein
VQDKMFNEKNCLENLKHIVSEYADDENLKNLSLDELRSSYTEIADNIFSISVSNCLKYRNMLWNIEYLKPEIRSKFQTELFNVWHSIYVKSEKTGPAEGLPEIIQQESAFVEEVEKGLKIDAPKQPFIESEKLKSDTSSEDTDFSSEIKPVKKQSPTTAQKASIKKYENDWFDKILDFFAAIVGSVSEIVGH